MESNIINSYMNLTLSDTAYKHLGNLLEQHNKKYVRLQVKGGGCAGFSYVFDYADEPQEGDIELDFEDFKLWVCPISEKYLKGTVIDWKKQGLNQQFIYMNPNESSSCGCGTSASFEL